jgi:crossover junction endodeoxyribonuclease RusA
MTRMFRLKDEAEYRELLVARATRFQRGGEVVNTDQRAKADVAPCESPDPCTDARLACLTGPSPAGERSDGATNNRPHSDAASSAPSTPDAASGNAADVAAGPSSPRGDGATSGTYVLVLPLPPSVNALYGTGQGGQRWLKPEQKEFRAEVRAILRRLDLTTLTGRLEVRVTLYDNGSRRWDIDGRLKALFDSLEHGGLYVNDHQIDVLWVERVLRRGKAEECVVHVREIPDAA